MSLVTAQPRHINVLPHDQLVVGSRGLTSKTDTELMIQHHNRAVQELSNEQKEAFKEHAAASFAVSTRRNYQLRDKATSNLYVPYL